MRYFRKLTYVIRPPNGFDCESDGWQFQLSRLHWISGNAGDLGWPYDPKIHNSYRLSSGSSDMLQVHLEINIEGDDLGQVGIEAFTYLDTVKTLLASRATADMGVGDEFELDEDLPAPVKVQRDTCGLDGAPKFKFVYADPHNPSDKGRWFAFHTDNDGIGEFARQESRKRAPSRKRADYCLKEKVTADDDDDEVVKWTMKCTFPAF